MEFTIVHSNITVSDLDRSVAFYEKAFGMKVVRRVEREEMGFRLAFMETQEGGHRLELTWYKDHDTYVPGKNEKRLGFIPHIGFVPKDFEKALEYHKKMGIVSLESPQRGVYFVTDPDGYWMEIVPLERAF
ncbi:MAG: VOC family protein [Sphaerochaetaceae bacterium]